MKVAVNPLVLAAALGLLGPAALAEDEIDPRERVAGVWTRTSQPDATPGTQHLGETIEVIPVEDRLVLDEGSGTTSSWERLAGDTAVHELVVDGAHVRRTLALDGDDLRVDVQVTRDGVTDAWSGRYIRTA